MFSQGIFSKVAFCRGKFPSVKIGRLLLDAGRVLREVSCFSSEVTLVRVVFLGKTSPPFLTSRRPEAVYEIKKGVSFFVEPR